MVTKRLNITLDVCEPPSWLGSPPGGNHQVLVAFRLGHASTAMIERHYGELGEGFDREIADRLSAARSKQARGGGGLAPVSSLAAVRRSRSRIPRMRKR
jgi:hypothetical protein